ncbi:putative exported protein [Granulibacter bethesdensis]|uniref:copper chaperone PCu(A)C n=1 Tax=Granulibacter bethesdensis TaxID=364410 RepID=UPI00090ADD11|nr:copper chaperone PCu(A)C [Granulibacter bethesdensis]APH56674.1 putative exported protein [Granulibacter bethesdensis]
MKRRQYCVLSLLAIGTWGLGSVSAQAEPPLVSEAWARPSMAAGHPGVVYLTIRGRGEGDRVVSFSTPVASSAELHRTTMEHGIMHMDPVSGLDVPASGTVRLTPGGYHIMLMGLKQGLKVGDHFPLTLTFQHAGLQTVDAVVATSGNGAHDLHVKDHH